MEASFKIKISPSLLSANKSRLRDEIEKISSADGVHWDIMDGTYVDAITFGAGTVKDCRQYSNLRFDVHLMIENPEKHFESFKAAGADMIIIHPETTKHLHMALNKIKSLGVLSGIALNPAVEIDAITYCKDLIDMVLVMSVNPGASGQNFLFSQVEKILKIRKFYPELEICVDGGINLKTIKTCFEAGANNFVSGAYVFSKDSKVAINELKKSIYD